MINWQTMIVDFFVGLGVHLVLGYVVKLSTRHWNVWLPFSHVTGDGLSADPYEISIYGNR